MIERAEVAVMIRAITEAAGGDAPDYMIVPAPNYWLFAEEFAETPWHLRRVIASSGGRGKDWLPRVRRWLSRRRAKRAHVTKRFEKRQFSHDNYVW